ncbi:MAG TPA: hypothetical protein PKC29_09900 [Thermodesulfobacteriota bacterium]|nr:hypothetical protein [Thermodesulfobacteriota bacterium]
MVDIEKALLNPSAVFSGPEDVLSAEGLTREQKVEILKRWEYDARELDVATEENMPGSNSSCLDGILKALDELGYDPNLDKEPPTKQGGS